ncbi:hypothetical protein D187_001305 [Cystobacter fuscus DSM 2262]|uniref:Uncharacterized protein n=1 Tax=Cystobacter fuscus (strain ATCC 25194 / DSM 2262 / NBRC 100088 / M29) TaxID=1242864 RepID=S9PC65_CYSF2|nr:hypothetical protein D187_001305 [Cystobacter fuscus DSM 2262]
MRVPLLAVALTAHPYAEPFWARDLTALVERLAEPPVDPADAERQRLFGDVVRFLNCEPLAPLRPEDSPLAPRALLRLEVARRGRLGASAAASATLWRDVLTPDFFRRSALLPKDQALRWPIEEENWPSETLELRLRPSSCAQPVPATDELPLLTSELEREVDKALGAEVAHRLLYHRASRLLTLGRADEAREVARRLSPSAMGTAPRPLGQLLRLGLGIDPPEGYLALVDEPVLAPSRLPIVAQAAAHLSTQARWREVLALTEPYAPGPEARASLSESPQRWDVFYRRALAYQALGEREPLARMWPSVFPALASAQEPRVEALRGIALVELARGTLDAQALTLLRDLGPSSAFPQRLATLGGLALDRGNVRLALDASERLLLEKSALFRARGHTLRAEVALASGDAAGLTRAVERLLLLRRQEHVPAKDLEELDRVVLALAQALVTASADLTEARWRPLLATHLDGMRQAVHSRHEKTFPALLAALEDRGPQAAAKGKRLEAFVAVGQVAVGAPPGLEPPPPLSVSWPEPWSLLALPLPEGSWRDWFPREPPSPVSAPAKTEVPHAP